MDTPKIKLLFICTHNSARSQMAEAWLNHLCSGFAVAKSAGLDPGELNPLAVEVMREVGLDISQAKTKSVNEVLSSGETFSRVIAVCSQEDADKCPMFPATGPRLNWTFKDPGKFEGTPDEKLANMRKIRDEIKLAITHWASVASAVQSLMR